MTYRLDATLQALLRSHWSQRINRQKLQGSALAPKDTSPLNSGIIVRVHDLQCENNI